MSGQKLKPNRKKTSSMPNRLLPFLFSAAIVFALTQVGFAQDWSQWRGPKLDSVADGQTVVEKLDDATKLWRYEMPGSGGSSPIVVGNRVFATSVDGESLVVICVDASTGDELWKKKVAGKNRASRDGANSASNSPCSDGTHVWTMFSNGQLNCFTLDGEEVWEKSLEDEYGKFDIQFGMSTTPILHDGQLLIGLMHGAMRGRDSQLPSVGTIVSLHAGMGSENWKHTRKTDAISENKHVYCSPCLAEADGETMLIIHGADYTTAHKIDSGDEVWRIGGMNPKGDKYNPYLRFVASPVSHEGLLVIPSAKRGSVWALPASQNGTLTADDLEWDSPRITPDVATPVVYNDRVFLAREKGTLACLDLKTGKKLIEQRYMADKHRSTPVAVDGKLVLTDRSGKVMLIKADESLEKISEIELGEETTASPAIAGGKIFVRTFDALYAFGEK